MKRSDTQNAPIYQLMLANKVYSGWGLRAWLILHHFRFRFAHRTVPLYTAEFSTFKDDCFPAKQLPALIVGRGNQRQIIWDSLAITEFLHEMRPEAGIWPQDAMLRAAARSLCCEMHSGFVSLRKKMPFNLRRTYTSFVPDAETRSDIERLCTLWDWIRREFHVEGPYLCGPEFSAPDAYFAPVAARFKTYLIELPDAHRSYCDLLLAHPGVTAYVKGALAEPWVLQHNEFEID